ncbi:M20/M25/M40 family metallo-hydrolase [Mycoplasma sp. P36-A1]|uniref:M20/M25/M40 family metallo-hydrolase n=1 Tax=Mycoplasma sp. P36-A1 TaxID=3252900 RepID=UPI003C2CEEB1
MKWQTKEELLALMKELVAIKSISATVDEVNAAKYVFEQLSNLEYYKNNPDHLRLVDVKGNFERKAVVALMSKGTSKNTLLGVGHFDTVGIDDAGILKDYILNPDEYTKQIGRLNLDPASKEDLASGEYLFGRGVMDMKAGVALHMQNLEYYSNSDSFDGNLLISFVGDEETNSEGVLAAVCEVAKMVEEFDLVPIAALDTEPDFASYPNDDNKYMYLGTVGKLLAGFFVLGKETHVGESLAGLNTHLILANIVKRMELNLDFCEKVGKEVTLPPTSLKMEDHKRLYNVQTPLSGHIYYNLQTFKDSPKIYMEKCVKIATDAINESYEFVLEMNKEFKELSNLPLVPLNLNPQVYTYADFYDEVKNEFSNIDELLTTKIEELQQKQLDERDLTCSLIQYMQEISSNKNPKVIVFFAPPYYPHVSLDDSKPNHKAVIAASTETIAYAKEKFGVDIKQCNYFQGLCDLSYFALEDAEDVLAYLKPNMPTLDKTYTLPLDDISKINVPVINYGPHGRDPHKYTERILVDYSFEVVPVVLKKLIENLFNNL